MTTQPTTHDETNTEYGVIPEAWGRALIDAIRSIESAPVEAGTFAIVLEAQLDDPEEMADLPGHMSETTAVPVPARHMTDEAMEKVVATVEGLARDIRENAVSIAARADADRAIEGWTHLIEETARLLSENDYWRDGGFGFE